MNQFYREWKCLNVNGYQNNPVASEIHYGEKPNDLVVNYTDYDTLKEDIVSGIIPIQLASINYSMFNVEYIKCCEGYNELLDIDKFLKITKDTKFHITLFVEYKEDYYVYARDLKNLKVDEYGIWCRDNIIFQK